ncbi:hypothetical protein FA15DRAFT_638287 [Coprinopsis marcescibilis]|nr:hypothetical protein FA15DRAFT_638287 [Coprinopsis marcescibilis]
MRNVSSEEGSHVPSSSQPEVVDSSSTTRVFDPQYHFVTSPVFSNPLVLAVLRLILAVYTLLTLIIVLQENVRRRPGQISFAFFTTLSFIGICAYLFASGVQTLLYALKSRQGASGYPLQQSWPRVLQALHVLLYTTVTTFPFIVTIFYWSVLSSPNIFAETSRAWNNISVHILNTVFALGEILLTNSPPVPWIALPLSVIILGAYCGLAYLVHAVAGFYPYSFLDPEISKRFLPAYLVGLAVGQCIVFTIVHFLVVSRIRVLNRSSRA